MTITMEMIDDLRKRTGANYSQAKEALEESEGKMIDAIIYLEKNYSLSGNDSDNSFKKKSKNFFKKLHDLKIDMTKDGSLELRIPGLLFILMVFPLFPIIILGVLIYMFLGYNFKISNINEDDTINSINDSLNNMSDKMNNI